MNEIINGNGLTFIVFVSGLLLVGGLYAAHKIREAHVNLTAAIWADMFPKD